MESVGYESHLFVQFCGCRKMAQYSLHKLLRLIPLVVPYIISGLPNHKFGIVGELLTGPINRLPQVFAFLREHEMGDDNVVFLLVIVPEELLVASFTESVGKADLLFGELIFLIYIIIEFHFNLEF